MKDVEWLLDGKRANVALPRHPLYVADTEDWQARVERVALSAQTDLYLNDIRAHAMVRVLPMQGPSTEYVVGQVAIDGGLTIEFDGDRATVSRQRTTIFRRTPPHVHVFKERSRVRSIGYRIELAKLEQYFDGDPPPPLRALLDGQPHRLEPFRGPNNRLLRAVAEQLFTPGLNGGLRRLMMDGLVMQLLALQVAAASTQPARRPAGLTLRQRAGVQEARERLFADMRNPPALGELAAAVGLTEKKLNAGFRELFGATAFEMLRDERLEHARRALEEEALSLKEVSFRVGYEHVSNFVHAFRDRFGAPPAQYLAKHQSEKRSRSTEQP